jgi:hypothetical protein
MSCWCVAALFSFSIISMLLVKFHSSGIFAGESTWKTHTLGCETRYAAILRGVEGIEFHYKLNVEWNNSTQNSTPESHTTCYGRSTEIPLPNHTLREWTHSQLFNLIFCDLQYNCMIC